MAAARKFDERSQGQFVGVTVSDEGEIFVADRQNKRILVFTLEGKLVPDREFPTVMPREPNSFRKPNARKLLEPYDVATDGEGNLWLVGRYGNDEFAVKYNKQGELLPGFRLQHTSLRLERGVAVDTKRNLILITQTTGNWDNLQGEVLVFKPDGKPVGTVGQQQGMKYPQYITVDRKGNILVSDRDNHCVYVYNGYGQLLFKFGGEGSGEGQLKNPRGICTYSTVPGNIIVADRGNSRVKMFDKTGKFLKHITTDIQEPCAVAIATLGQLIVTDHMYQTGSIFSNYYM